MCVPPIYHINGLCVTVMGTLMSSSGLAMPYRFSVRAFWKQVRDSNVSWFSAVPTLFAYLLNDETLLDIDRDRPRFAVGIGPCRRRSTAVSRSGSAFRSSRPWG